MSACAPATTQTPSENKMLVSAKGSSERNGTDSASKRQVDQHVIFQAGAKHQRRGRFGLIQALEKSRAQKARDKSSAAAASGQIWTPV